MKSVYFGVANGVMAGGRYRDDGYDDGKSPACALNRQNQFVEVHKNEAGDSLYYWSGSVVGTELTLPAHGPIAKPVVPPNTPTPDTGYNPSVAINNNGVVVEAHDSGNVMLGFGTKLYWWLGQASNDGVTWLDHDGISTKRHDATGGVEPAIAINDSGIVVEIHDSGHKTLWSWVGRVEGTSIKWNKNQAVNVPEKQQKDEPDTGRTPSVAINNHGLVLEVHSSGDPDAALWYWLGQVNSDGTAIEWYEHHRYDTGVAPSVSLGDDGTVIEVHQSENSNTLYQRIGYVTGNTLMWVDPFGASPPQPSCPFDAGANPSVAFNGSVAVQVHETGDDFTLYGTASIWTDRATWMTQYASVLGPRSLKNVVMPASHDSGMFLYVTGNWINPRNWSIFGKTQSFNFYQQLLYGVRYFDIRPRWDGSRFVLDHTVNGATLTDLIQQVTQFYAAGAREPVILKFSHYADFTQASFEALCSQIGLGLGSLLYPGPVPAATRFADTTLSTLVNSGKPLIAVFDACVRPSVNPPAKTFVLPSNVSGLWIYRDWYAADPENGDLTVFDVYADVAVSVTDMEYSQKRPNSGTEDPVTQKPVDAYVGQLPNFWELFNGRCLHNSSEPCDLFLLSWTLTPPTAVYPFSRLANKVMGYTLSLVGENTAGLHLNLLYADYVQDSRATDIALVRNGCFSPEATAEPTREVKAGTVASAS